MSVAGTIILGVIGVVFAFAVSVDAPGSQSPCAPAGLSDALIAWDMGGALPTRINRGATR